MTKLSDSRFLDRIRFFTNMIHHGTISTMPVRLEIFNGKLTIIRLSHIESDFLP